MARDYEQRVIEIQQELTDLGHEIEDALRGDDYDAAGHLSSILANLIEHESWTGLQEYASMLDEEGD